MPASAVMRVRFEAAGLMISKYGWLKCLLAVDANKAKGGLVEFVAIGALNLELMHVWLGERIGVASKRLLSQTPRVQTETKLL